MPSAPDLPRIAVPALPSAPAPYVFPLVATIAPVGVSVVVWIVTQSPLALVFAALGPVIAVGSFADGRLQARRRRRSESARFAREIERARCAVADAHAVERSEAERAWPPAAALAARETPGAWTVPVSPHALLVRLGVGVRASALELSLPPPDDSAESRALEALAGASRRLDAAPVAADAAAGIGIVGGPLAAESLARAVVFALAARLHPATVSIVMEGAEAPWLRALPHEVSVGPPDDDSRGSVVRFTGSGLARDVLVAVGRRADVLPAGLATIVATTGATGGSEGTGLVLVGALADGVRLDLTDRLSEEEARAGAVRCAEQARREGAVAASRELPSTAAFADLDHQAPAPSGGLAAAVGREARGVVVLDLVTEGPHAIVGGTTGSGKSELLITWVLAIAARHGPERVTFLLADFKGGASFDPLRRLPHCVGVLTDLDEHAARRAFESLAAELRYRERLLARRGRRSIDELEHGVLPRLVIVVDEFAAVAAGLPELHGVFGDLAARGRSLGIHLVLCTQRPAGVVRDAVLANCALRLSLRVTNAADSTAVIGSDAAARLPPALRGRALLATGDGEPRAVQLALATDADIARVADRWRTAAGPAPRRPWRDPLPTTVPPASLPADPPGGRVFGLLDLPHEQSQPPAAWLPAQHGSLLIVGGSGAGRTTVVRALARPRDLALDADHPDAAWDVVERLGVHRGAPVAARPAGGGRALIIDDLDVLLDRFGDEHRQEFVDRLTRVLRQGPGRGLHAVITVQRSTATIGALAALCGSRLLLRMPDRNEHVLAGGSGDGYRDDLPAGGGLWRGARVQVARVEAEVQVAPRHPPAVIDVAGGLCVVAGRPRECAARLRSAFPGARVTMLGDEPPGHPPGPGPVEPANGSPNEPSIRAAPAPPIIVGDPDAWQSRWGAIAAVRETTPILIDGCTLADYRAVLRERLLPPPLTDPGEAWLVQPSGEVVRTAIERED